MAPTLLGPILTYCSLQSDSQVPDGDTMVQRMVKTLGVVIDQHGRWRFINCRSILSEHNRAYASPRVTDFGQSRCI